MNENHNYINDLDRFIKGEICFDEIKGYISQDKIYWAIIYTGRESLFYSEEEHDLYEKICYADILRICQDLKDNRHEPFHLYRKYLYLKDISAPHILDWDNWIENIKKEMNMEEWVIKRAESWNENYHKEFDWYDDDSDE